MHGDLHTLFGQLQRDSASDPARAAGDERMLPPNRHKHLQYSLFLRVGIVVRKKRGVNLKRENVTGWRLSLGRGGEHFSLTRVYCGKFTRRKSAWKRRSE